MSQPPTGRPDSDPPSEARRVLALLRADIAARVRPLVSHLPEELVAALIDDIARIKFKYEGIGALRRTPAAPVAAVRNEPSME